MRLTATDSERGLQDEIRAFLAAERPDATRLPRSLEDRMEVLRDWQGRCHEAGYVGRAWPREFGGGGGPAAEQIVIDQELAAAGAPEFINVVGLDVSGGQVTALYSMLNPAKLAHLGETSELGLRPSSRSAPPR